jgi:hypothetical protein
VAELADAADSKSAGVHSPSRFDPEQRHHLYAHPGTPEGNHGIAGVPGIAFSENAEPPLPIVIDSTSSTNVNVPERNGFATGLPQRHCPLRRHPLLSESYIPPPRRRRAFVDFDITLFDVASGTSARVRLRHPRF